MSRQDRHPYPQGLPDSSLDRAVAAVRDEDVSPEVVEAAAQRVWARLALETGAADPNQHPIESCGDYQALLPAYLAGELNEARTLLVEDHTRHCLPCRKALTAARTKERTGVPTRVASEAEPRRQPASSRADTSRHVRHARRARYLALAAVLTLMLVTGALLTYTGTLRFGPAPVMAQIQTLEGTLLRPGQESTPLAVGASLREGERVRTAKDSGAVLTLTDGTRIEMSERAELTLDHGWRGNTIRMDGGRIIVEAAKQKHGRLYVSTEDCLVSVVGTVFSVNEGLKGSRVSVLEGEVRVARGGETDVLKPGDQITTGPILGRVPLAQEISWSRSSERYKALLDELEHLRREIARRVTRPELRYTSDLLPLVPADTVGYVAAPNLSKSLDETYRLIQEQLETSPQLKQVWQQMVVDTGVEPHLEALITQVRDLGGYLGDEVVVALPLEVIGETHQGAGPVVLAQVVRPGFEVYLEQEIARINGEAGHPVLSLVGSGEPAGEMAVWTDGNFMVASPSTLTLRATIAAIGSGDSGFRGTPFHRRLQAAYAQGVDWLGAFDLGELVASRPVPDLEDARKVGLDNLGQILVEHRSLEDRSETGVQLTFDGPRQGVFSWLAEPAPMRSLDFVSPAAPMVLGLVTKEPVDMLADLARLATNGTGDAVPPELEELEKTLGVDLEDDVASALGGEMAFSIDGPLLQGVPWKLVLEVYDSNRLQGALERLAAKDLHVTDHPLELSSETAAGRTYYTLKLHEGMEIHYTFADGFLVAAPSRALVDRALQLHASGTGLVISEAFRSLLPADGETNFSALFYQDTGRLTEMLNGVGVQQIPASLAYAYGYEDSIEAALVTPGDPLGLDWLLRMLFGFGAAQSGMLNPTPTAPTAGGPVS